MERNTKESGKEIESKAIVQIKQHLNAHIQLTLSQKGKSVSSKLTVWRLFVFQNSRGHGGLFFELYPSNFRNQPNFLTFKLLK